jgi:hypothetical protein
MDAYIIARGHDDSQNFFKKMESVIYRKNKVDEQANTCITNNFLDVLLLIIILK